MGAVDMCVIRERGYFFLFGYGSMHMNVERLVCVYMKRLVCVCVCGGRKECLCIGRDEGVVGVFVDRETQCRSLCVFVERLENVIMYLCRDRFVCGETGACLNTGMCLCVFGVRDGDVLGEREYWCVLLCVCMESWVCEYLG